MNTPTLISVKQTDIKKGHSGRIIMRPDNLQNEGYHKIFLFPSLSSLPSFSSQEDEEIVIEVERELDRCYICRVLSEKEVLPLLIKRGKIRILSKDKISLSIGDFYRIYSLPFPPLLPAMATEWKRKEDTFEEIATFSNVSKVVQTLRIKSLHEDSRLNVKYFSSSSSYLTSDEKKEIELMSILEEEIRLKGYISFQEYVKEVIAYMKEYAIKNYDEAKRKASSIEEYNSNILSEIHKKVSLMKIEEITPYYIEIDGGYYGMEKEDNDLSFIQKRTSAIINGKKRIFSGTMTEEEILSTITSEMFLSQRKWENYDDNKIVEIKEGKLGENAIYDAYLSLGDK